MDYRDNVTTRFRRRQPTASDTTTTCTVTARRQRSPPPSLKGRCRSPLFALAEHTVRLAPSTPRHNNTPVQVVPSAECLSRIAAGSGSSTLRQYISSGSISPVIARGDMTTLPPCTSQAPVLLPAHQYDHQPQSPPRHCQRYSISATTGSDTAADARRSPITKAKKTNKSTADDNTDLCYGGSRSAERRLIGMVEGDTAISTAARSSLTRQMMIQQETRTHDGLLDAERLRRNKGGEGRVHAGASVILNSSDRNRHHREGGPFPYHRPHTPLLRPAEGRASAKTTAPSFSCFPNDGSRRAGILPGSSPEPDGYGYRASATGTAALLTMDNSASADGVVTSWLSVPMSMKCQLLDLAAELDLPMVNILEDSIKLFTDSLRSKLRHRRGRGAEKEEQEDCGHFAAERHENARRSSSVLQASTEVFNAAQKLAYCFPDVGVSLVISPRDRKQLVFKSNGDETSARNAAFQQELHHSSEDPVIEYFGGQGGGEEFGITHRRMISRKRGLDYERAESLNHMADLTAAVAGAYCELEKGSSRQDQNDCRSSLKDSNATLRAGNIFTDQSRGGGDNDDAGTELVYGGMGDHQHRDHVLRMNHEHKRKRVDETKRTVDEEQNGNKTFVRRDVAEHCAAARRGNADSTETCSDVSDDGETSRKDGDERQKIFRQRWTKEQMNELRRVVLSEPVPYGRWNEVLEKSEILKASHFTAEAARKKAMRMGLLR